MADSGAKNKEIFIKIVKTFDIFCKVGYNTITLSK